jgi:hypothetical protein
MNNLLNPTFLVPDSNWLIFNGQFYSYKRVLTGPEIQWPFNFWPNFQMAIKKPDHFVQFSNGYNKRAAKNGPVFGWRVPAKIDHSKTCPVFCWKSASQRLSSTLSENLSKCQNFQTSASPCSTTWVVIVSISSCIVFIYHHLSIPSVTFEYIFLSR